MKLSLVYYFVPIIFSHKKTKLFNLFYRQYKLLQMKIVRARMVNKGMEWNAINEEEGME